MDATHPELYFIRHGETDWNAEQRLQGQKDIPLNAKGRAQASANGKRLKNIIKDKDFNFIASPLGRTMETMRLLRHEMGLDENAFALEPRLKEVSFGDIEGFTLSELQHSHPHLAKARKEDRWHFTPPNGESYHSTGTRVLDWLSFIKQPSVVVAHGGIIRILRKHLLNLSPAQIEEYLVPQDKVFHWTHIKGQTQEEIF